MTHSKGPFTLTENSWSDTSLYDSSGRRLALLSIESDCDEYSQAEWEKRQAADAAVLLEALNVHEQTGLTPAQLQTRVAELEGALRVSAEYIIKLESFATESGAEAYDIACEEMEAWQEKRRKAGKEIGTQGSLVDGIGWLYERLDELEALRA